MSAFVNGISKNLIFVWITKGIAQKREFGYNQVQRTALLRAVLYRGNRMEEGISTA